MSWSGRGDRSVFAAVVTFMGGLGSQAGEGDVISLLPRDHAERRACMRGPRGAHDGGGLGQGQGTAKANRDGRSLGVGTVEDGLAPHLQTCKRG